MRTLLLLGWIVAYLPATAQTRAAGPWRLVSHSTRTERWGGIADGGTPADSAHILRQPDTTTTVWVRRVAQRVPWNVHPDSITLFLDCQNPLTLPHGRPAPTRFKATGAAVHLDTRQHLVLLVPTAPVVVLWAYRGHQLVFRHEFKAVPPPLPIIKCYNGGCDASICKGPSERPGYRRTITFRAIPDPDFAAILPEDARYRIARFQATLLRQAKAVELAPGQLAEKTIQGPQGDMSALAAISQLGDQLQLDVLLVQRLNSRGIITEVPALKRFVMDGPKCPHETQLSSYK